MNAYKTNCGQYIVYLDYSSSVGGPSTIGSTADPTSLASIMIGTMIPINDIHPIGMSFPILLPDETTEENPRVQQVGGVINLDTLNAPEYVLRHPIAVRIEWDDEMGCFVAYEEALGLWYGAGDSKENAVSVLQEVLIGVYADLESNQDHLHPRLCRQLDQMRRVIAHAG